MRPIIRKHLVISILASAMFCLIYPLACASALGEGWRLCTSTTIYNPFADSGIAHNGYVYVISYPYYYQWALVQPNGTLGNFTSAPIVNGSYTISQDVGLSLTTTSNNYIYGSGGTSGYTGGPVESGVWFSLFNPDGSLSPTIYAGNMLTSRQYHGSLIVNGIFYAFGGFVGSSPPLPLNTVEYEPLNTDGTLSTGHYTSSFSKINGTVYLTWYDGSSVYCVGSGNGLVVERAIQQSDGSLSTWTTLTGPFSFTGPTVLTKRTTLFVIQNAIADTSINYNYTYKMEQYNPLMSGRNFQSAPHTIYSAIYFPIATWDRFVYVIGGANPNPPYQNYNTIELYDPDLAGTELFPDDDVFLKSSRFIYMNKIKLDLE